jgi:very-short-patch-repair endonuclease
MNPLSQNERFTITINNWKSKLLDLSKRNRALNFKINKVSTITVVDEQPSEIFKLLCLQGKSLKFLPQAAAEIAPGEQTNEADDEESENDLPAPDFVPYQAANLADRHTDEFLQTNSTPEKLDKSLRRLEEQSHSVIEEQGVNALFLSLGTLHYNESRDSKEFYKAPLILVPAELSRKSARGGFTVNATEDEIIINPSLIEYLRRNFSIALPEIPDSSQLTEDYDVQQFFAAATDAVSNQTDWKIKNEIYLALFSFQKLVMYKDLERNAENLASHKIIGKIIGKSGEQIIGLPEEIRRIELDRDFPPEATAQVVDADSSQLRAITTVAKNYDLVLEGPPGTGKSQTITNLVAESLSAGKTVLFVAEKMAALEVVHRRLAAVGLGEFCLELHSTKANKRAVMQEIRSALDASLQRIAGTRSSTERLPFVREQLTAYARAVHESYGALNLSPYRVYGELGAVLNAPKFALQADIFDVSQTDLTDVLRDLKDLSVAAESVGSPAKHPWRETTKTFYTESDFDQIASLGADLKQRLEQAINLADSVEKNLGLPPIKNFADVETAASIASVMARSPGAPIDVLNSEAWNSPPPEAKGLIEKGRNLAALREKAAQVKVLTDENYEKLADISGDLIESGRKINRLCEEVSKLTVLREQIYEQFSIESARLIALGRKINELSQRVGKNFNESVNEQDPTDDIAFIEEKSSGFFSFLAFLSGRYRTVKKRWLSYRLPNYQAKLIEQAEDMKTVAELWRTRRELEANDALGRKVFGSLWQGEKSNWNALEKYARWMTSFRLICSEKDSLLDINKVRTIENEAADVRAALNAHRQTAGLAFDYLTTWEAMEKDLKTALEYFYERLSLSEKDSAGASFFGSLWEGENSDWANLESYRMWLLGFRKLCLANNLNQKNVIRISQLSDEINELASIEKRGADLRENLIKYQRSKNLSEIFLDSWKASETDLATVSEYSRNRENLEARNDSAKQLFGALWQGEASEFSSLENYISWVLDFRRLCVSYGLREQAAQTASLPAPDVTNVQLLARESKEIQNRLAQLSSLVGWRENYFENANLPDILNRISEIIDNINLASRWAAFETVRQKVVKGIAGELLIEAMRERFSFQDLEAIFRRAFYQKWLARVVQERAELLHFQTLTHEQRVKEFRELDESVLSENRAELVGSLREKLQNELQKPEMRGVMNFLRGQLARQRKLAPLRVTMKHAFNAIRAIKPCFMMSPQSVAQLLENAEDKFDVVIFDEASQMPTEEAVGAILRGRQLVVVGDPKQLPPTNFFAVQSGTVNVQYDEDGLPLLDDSQSILEEVAGAGVANSRLKWHYRSAQESLITFSNVSFYDGDLYTFPSVETDSYDTGLHFEFVEDGVYEGKGLNLTEARRVADAVVEHAKTKPEISLGVGTFNMRQQLAVLDELEQHRRLDPTLEPFFDRNKSEPFFVKNLENIQGDERDAIFLSVTYAKARDGRLRYNFGPLNGENGWRRLNVLTTRARRLMRVFSSIKGEDINPVATVSQGAQLLRDFLTYAEHKRLDSPILSAIAETESPFERDVMQELNRRGIKLVPQVGVSGYRIDLGVLDGEIEGRFVCGIECDGAAYHSSATARDRDRLRQQVLESRGWEIHRVWSTDWFKDRAGQIERLLGLIEKSRETARREHDEEIEREKFIQSENEKLARQFLGEISDVEIEGIFTNAESQNYVRPQAAEYEFAEISNFVSWQTLLDAPTAQLAQAILQIVEVESPVHFKDLAIRSATAWGTRAGSRITSRIAEIVQLLRQANRLELRGEFVWKPNGEFQLRSRSGTQIPAERIAPEEVQEAILQVLRAGKSGFTRPELVNEARAVFGFNRTGAALQQVINDAVDALLAKGLIGEGSLGIALREQ